MDKVAQKLQQQGYFTPGFVSDVRQRLDAIRASSGSVP
jgi:hypothetical protein